jgi:hypothetical protein
LWHSDNCLLALKTDCSSAAATGRLRELWCLSVAVQDDLLLLLLLLLPALLLLQMSRTWQGRRHDVVAACTGGQARING